MNKVIYLGKDRNAKNKIIFIFKEIEEDLSLGKTWRFSKKLFRKGTVGAIYEVEFEGSSISYSEKQEPSYMLKVGETHKSSSIIYKEVINKCESKDDIISREERLTKKEFKIMDQITKDLRDSYRYLSSYEKPLFIAELIRRITR